MDFGSEFECLEFKNQASGYGSIEKIGIAAIGFRMIPGSIFHDFGWPWDQFS